MRRTILTLLIPPIILAACSNKESASRTRLEVRPAHEILIEQSNQFRRQKDAQAAPIRSEAESANIKKQEVTTASVEEPSHERPELQNVELAEPLQEFIYEQTMQNDIDYTMFMALIKTESNFDPELVYHNDNGTTDHGLVQMNSVNIKRLSAKLNLEQVDVYNPYHSVLLAIEELKESREYWEDTYSGDQLEQVMFMSYNMGNYGMKKFIRKNGFVDSRYMKKLKQNMNLLKAQVTQ